MKDLANLPKKYFDYMTKGEELAKEGKFEDAYDYFAKAIDECASITKFFMSKIADETGNEQIIEDLMLHEIWELKLIKAAFFAYMAKYNVLVKKGDKNAKNELLICYGVQSVGKRLLNLIEQYLQKYRKKLHFMLPEMFDIISENWTKRQELLENILKEEEIEILSLLHSD